MRVTRSPINSGPRRFMGGAVRSTKSTAPSLRTLRVSKTMASSRLSSFIAFDIFQSPAEYQIARRPPTPLPQSYECRADFGREQFRLFLTGEAAPLPTSLKRMRVEHKREGESIRLWYRSLPWC